MPPRDGDDDATTDVVAAVGTVDHVFFRSDDGRFAVVAVTLEDGGTWRAKGPLGSAHLGDVVELRGKVVIDPRYGRELRVQSAVPRLPVGREGVVRMLDGLGVRGVARRTAERIVDTLGDDALATLRADPEAIRRVRGLKGARGDALVAALHARLDAVAGDAALADLGLGPSAISRLHERYPGEALLRVRDDPYAAVGAVAGLGFRTADAVARALGVAEDADARVDAGLAHALDGLARRGHTAPPRSLAVERSAALLGLAPSDVEPAVARGVVAGRLVRARVTTPDGGDEERLGLARYVTAEAQVAADVERLAAAHGSRHGDDELRIRLELASAELGVALGETQAAAICAALGGGLHVVTGGPGTGKTTIVRGLLAALRPDGVQVVLAAPTGRAARRLAEATGATASTLHRLLEFEPRTRHFARNADHPLDADLVVVDEASMIDVPLASALLGAIAAGGRLLLIGDADQLPSVGPGAVLDDLLASGVVAATRLSQVYRQGERSGIVAAAHELLCGRAPVGARDEKGDLFVVLRADADAVADGIVEVATRRLPDRYGLDPRHDIAVLVPMHRGPVGTRELNARLGGLLNPTGAVVAQARGVERLRAGDKVLQTRNNYDLDVFNGDVGVVDGAVDHGVAVRYGERAVVYDAEALSELEPAWAMTVHKAQGSEVPAVVVGLEDAHHVLLERNLLYTAITRARRKVVVVATPRAFERAVRNTAPRWRATLLGALLRGEAAWPARAPQIRRPASAPHASAGTGRQP